MVSKIFSQNIFTVAGIGLFFFMNSCVNMDVKKVVFPEVTRYLNENCYQIDYVGDTMNLQILNSSIIASERKKSLPTFSYAQYASICALLICRNELNGVNTIKCTIIDNNYRKDFHYLVSDVRSVDKKLKVDYDFGIAMQKNDLKTAKNYFSDSLKSLSDEEIDKSLFKKYFGYGQISNTKLVAFTIVGKKVGNFIEYEFEDKRRQSYIFVHELNGHDHIVEIMFPTVPNEN